MVTSDSPAGSGCETATHRGTDETTSLRALGAKESDVDILRQMIGFAAD
jgi:hypothetical protein